MRFEASRHVHRIADAGVGRALVRSRVARDHLTRRDADADAYLRFAGGLLIDVEKIDELDHFQRGERGALAMIGEWQRNAEDSHQSIAGDLADDSAVAADRVEHQRVERVQELDRLFGRLRFCQRREASNVGEQDRSAHALAAERKPRLRQILCHFRRRKAAHELFELIPQALLFETGADPRFEQPRIHRLVEIVFGAELDAAHHMVDSLQR